MDKRATDVGAESDAESLKLLADHGRPNDGGTTKSPRCDGRTIREDIAQVEKEGFCAEGNVIISSTNRQLRGW